MQHHIDFSGKLALSMLYPGKPRMAGHIKAYISHQLRHHGPQFLVERLKSLRSYILGHKTGHPLLDPPFRVDRRGRPKGTLGLLWDLAQTRKGFYKVLRFLKLTAIWKAPITKEVYVEEALRIHSIEAEEPIIRDLSHLKKQPPVRYKRPRYPVKDVVTAICGETRRYRECSLSDHSRSLDSCPALVLKHYELINSYFGIKPRQHYLLLRKYNVVGAWVVLNKDGSYKKRSIFVPNSILQLCMEELYQSLDAYSRKLPRLFVHDQQEGIRQVGVMLRSSDLYSIDLTACTDHWPLEFQVRVLRKLFPHLWRDIALFEDISKGVFVGKHDVEVSFKRGQPMGLKPSFLAMSVSLYHFLDGSDTLQVGDDLVTNNPRVIAWLEEAKIPISPHKTLYNSPIAEFCGTVIDLAGGDRNVRKLKFPSLDSPFDIIERVGVKAFSFFPRKERRVLQAMALLPRPVGLGLSPDTVFELSDTEFADLFEPPIRLNQHQRPPHYVKDLKHEIQLMLLRNMSMMPAEDIGGFGARQSHESLASIGYLSDGASLFDRKKGWELLATEPILDTRVVESPELLLRYSHCLRFVYRREQRVDIIGSSETRDQGSRAVFRRYRKLTASVKKKLHRIVSNMFHTDGRGGNSSNPSLLYGEPTMGSIVLSITLNALIFGHSQGCGREAHAWTTLSSLAVLELRFPAKNICSQMFEIVTTNNTDHQIRVRNNDGYPTIRGIARYQSNYPFQSLNQDWVNIDCGGLTYMFDKHAGKPGLVGRAIGRYAGRPDHLLGDESICTYLSDNSHSIKGMELLWTDGRTLHEEMIHDGLKPILSLTSCDALASRSPYLASYLSSIDICP